MTTHEVYIEVKNVSKWYGTLKALSNVNLSAQGGQIVGLLGPNGSGKSTLIKIMVGLLRPDTGYVSICGYDPIKDAEITRRIIGYVPEEVALYESLSVREFFEFIARVRKIRGFKEKIYTFIEAFNLKDHLDDLIGSLSKGNRQKVALIAALIHSPMILFLDEPLSGLDPITVRVLKDYLIELKKKGRLIIFSTHILEIAEKICDKIALMHKGKVIAYGNVDEITSLSTEKSLEEVFLQITGKGEEVNRIIEALKGV